MRQKTLKEEIPQTAEGIRIYIAECVKEMEGIERARRKAEKRLAMMYTRAAPGAQRKEQR